jgi:hypothetical protein
VIGVDPRVHALAARELGSRRTQLRGKHGVPDARAVRMSGRSWAERRSGRAVEEDGDSACGLPA